MRSPLIWVGGKFYMIKNLLPLIPPHHTYVEVFGGAGQLLFAKSPSPVEVYNDINSGLVNFFRVVRDEKKMLKLKQLLELTPYSREEFYFCRDTWEDVKDDIEKARRFFVVVRQSFSGNCQTWGYAVSKSWGGMSGMVSNYLSAIGLLPAICKRLMNVQIDNDSWQKIIDRYDTEDTFLFLDPPYVHSTRKEEKFYDFEMTDDDHKELVERIMKVKGKVILSGYKNEIYEPLEQAGWKRLDFNTICWSNLMTRTRIKKIKDKRIESVWINPQGLRKNIIQENLF